MTSLATAAGKMPGLFSLLDRGPIVGVLRVRVHISQGNLGVAAALDAMSLVRRLARPRLSSAPRSLSTDCPMWPDEYPLTGVIAG